MSTNLPSTNFKFCFTIAIILCLLSGCALTLLFKPPKSSLVVNGWSLTIFKTSSTVTNKLFGPASRRSDNALVSTGEPGTDEAAGDGSFFTVTGDRFSSNLIFFLGDDGSGVERLGTFGFHSPRGKVERNSFGAFKTTYPSDIKDTTNDLTFDLCASF